MYVRSCATVFNVLCERRARILYVCSVGTGDREREFRLRTIAARQPPGGPNFRELSPDRRRTVPFVRSTRTALETLSRRVFVVRKFCFRHRLIQNIKSSPHTRVRRKTDLRNRQKGPGLFNPFPYTALFFSTVADVVAPPQPLGPSRRKRPTGDHWSDNRDNLLPIVYGNTEPRTTST